VASEVVGERIHHAVANHSDQLAQSSDWKQLAIVARNFSGKTNRPLEESSGRFFFNDSCPTYVRGMV
jgi:hypothetical protein